MPMWYLAALFHNLVELDHPTSLAINTDGHYFIIYMCARVRVFEPFLYLLCVCFLFGVNIVEFYVLTESANVRTVWDRKRPNATF